MSSHTLHPIPYLSRFATESAFLPGQSLAWLRDVRVTALAEAKAIGAPSRRSEAWRYTDLGKLWDAALTTRPFPPLSQDQVQSEGRTSVSFPCYRLMFVNGRLAGVSDTLKSLPTGMRLTSLAAAWEDSFLAEELRRHFRLDEADHGRPKDALYALNTAFMSDGCYFTLPAGVKLDLPVVIDHYGDLPAGFHLRHIIRMEAGSQAAILERYQGAGDCIYWTQPVLEAVLENHSSLTHLRLQDEGRSAFHIGRQRFVLHETAQYDGFSLALGAGLSRLETLADIEGANAEGRFNGCYRLSHQQHCDHTSDIRHDALATVSQQTFKGILEDQARAVFQGRIVVEPHAQKTEAHQLNKTLLLSRGAEIDTKPQLEINADDVKCSHGASVGNLDPSALFYLRARGIDESEARRLLVQAFLQDTLDLISYPPFHSLAMSAMGMGSQPAMSLPEPA